MFSMKNQPLFKWKHYQSEMILLTGRQYLQYSLSFRDLVEMREKRGDSLFLILHYINIGLN
jgi:transposase, IS6 family